jgi:hypothetical protein
MRIAKAQAPAIRKLISMVPINVSNFDKGHSDVLFKRSIKGVTFGSTTNISKNPTI